MDGVVGREDVFVEADFVGVFVHELQFFIEEREGHLVS